MCNNWHIVRYLSRKLLPAFIFLYSDSFSNRHSVFIVSFFSKMSSVPVKKVPLHLQSSQNRLIIKNGKIVNADGVSDCDIFIEGGVIKEIGRNLIIPGGTRAIDAQGKYIFPGGIDPHTHFKMDFMGTTSADDFYNGTKAAVAGGTTTIIDFVIPEPDQSLIEAYRARRGDADSKVCCDYGLHVVCLNSTDHTKSEMTELTKEQYGVNSFKFFMAYKGALMVSDPDLYVLMEHVRAIGGLAMVHAENGDVIAENEERLLAAGVTGPIGHPLSRQEDVETEAVTRAIMIANQVSCPLYVAHVMCRDAGEAVSRGRSNGNVVFGETLAAGIGSDGTAYTHSCWENAAGHVLGPPIRNEQKALMNFLVQDVFQTTGSDHCVFTKNQKAMGKDNFTLIPNGVNGVEERLALAWQYGVNAGLLDLPRFVQITSTNAAKLFNLYPRKGALAVGSDADIVIWDPKKLQTISASSHHSAGDFNIFEGTQVTGAPQFVLVNGRVCVDDYELKAVEGIGNYVSTSPWASEVYDKVLQREVKLGIKPKSVTSNGAAESVPVPVQVQITEEIQQNSKLVEVDNEPQIGVSSVKKSSIKVANPPGGKSAGGFW